MSFITETDLAKSLHQELIDEIKRGDNAVVEHAINATVAEMKPYLSTNFDVDSIFGATGNNRDGLLVVFAVDVAIYNLLSLVAPDTNLDDRRARYKRAIDWLKQVNNSELVPDLPVLDIPKAEELIVYGSVERKDVRY